MSEFISKVDFVVTIGRIEDGIKRGRKKPANWMRPTAPRLSHPRLTLLSLRMTGENLSSFYLFSNNINFFSSSYKRNKLRNWLLSMLLCWVSLILQVPSAIYWITWNYTDTNLQWLLCGYNRANERIKSWFAIISSTI